MKRIIVFLTAVLLVLSLASCGNKADSIKKAFENADYEVTTLSGANEEVQALFTLMQLSDEQKEDIAKYELIVCKKSVLPSAIIIKFPSASDLKDFLTVEDEDGKKDTSLYDDANEAGKINGNCYLVYGGSAEKDLFK